MQTHHRVIRKKVPLLNETSSFQGYHRKHDVDGADISEGKLEKKILKEGWLQNDSEGE